MTQQVTVVIPCLNEEGAIPGVLAKMPFGYQVIVVDNGSDDATAAVAADGGARVVHESAKGYGAAVQAGIDAAVTEVVAVLDGDGSMDPGELPALVFDVVDGGADLAVGRRRPVRSRDWPIHARAGNGLLAYRLRHHYGLPVHDIGAMRVARRQSLLDLGPLHPRFGYPLELLVRASRSGWSVSERDITYSPRTHGASKVSGSLIGTLRVVRDFWAVR
ncbi:glycosyltransferase family 2 protein [Antrihabitans cavernicola]|uniref:Glycosyltransferase family 2 protein n=1 Tax=Antrihabitans cavernicola TaxID=2495913 RepID=A0A5A7S8M6_9NOCA|nr:glycosyltransferase family 2 protein [Spelaeibacter cavernicola]KAA0021502.1 glycosyltransferase family 2 protein [Spelaeibacter cavernicola]